MKSKRRIIDCADTKRHSSSVEIGGTVGDIESLPFLEAIRQMRYEKQASCLNIHVTYVPYIKAAGEVKTKPTQHSVQVLREIGISPDIILCRSESSLSSDVKEKISLFCNVREDAVIECVDVQHSIYEVPLAPSCPRHRRKDLPDAQPPHRQLSNLESWENLIETIRHPKGVITVGIVGKYVQHQDAYKSVFEALQHGAFANGYKIDIRTH